MRNLNATLASLTLFGFASATSAATPTNQELFEMYKAASDKLAALEASIEESTVETTIEAPSGLVGSNSAYNFKVLDHSRDTNTKQLVQLQALRDGELKQP